MTLQQKTIMLHLTEFYTEMQRLDARLNAQLITLNEYEQQRGLIYGLTSIEMQLACNGEVTQLIEQNRLN
jgi:hypothetical protein